MKVCSECGQFVPQRKHKPHGCSPKLEAHLDRLHNRKPRITVAGSLNNVLCVVFENDKGTYVGWKV